jgi:hypothetical protein
MLSNSEKWREIAEAILQENDPDSVSRLVNELCQALDSGAVATSSKAAAGSTSKLME